QTIPALPGLRPRAEKLRFPALSLCRADHFLLQQELGSLERLLGDIESGLGLHVGRLREPEVAAVEPGQEITGLHLLTDIGIHIDYSTADKCRDLGERTLV